MCRLKAFAIRDLGFVLGGFVVRVMCKSVRSIILFCFVSSMSPWHGGLLLVQNVKLHGGTWCWHLVGWHGMTLLLFGRSSACCEEVLHDGSPS